MSTAVAPAAGPAKLDGQPMTEEEFLALPEDGVQRWLIDGRVREFGMTTRNFFHGHATARVGKFLDNWLDTQPAPQGAIIAGEAGVRFPDGTVVGVDVAYVPAGLVVTDTSERTIVDGVPPLIVEIMSPKGTNEEWADKLDIYQAAAVPVVWKLDPYDRTVTVYRAGQPPVLFNETQALTADPELPGFRVPVAHLFGR